MNNKKAQGLPLNLIILAIVAALVLVLILAFTIGGAGSIFGKIFKTGTTAIGEDLETVQATCTDLCTEAEAADEPETSEFCTKTFNVDLDGDDLLADDERGISCESVPEVSCTVIC